MEDPSRIIRVTIAADAPRLDKALAAALPEALGLSRSRVQALISGGGVSRDGTVLPDPKTKVRAGDTLVLSLPDPTPAEAGPEAIPLSVVYEDDDLIVIDKPAGMVVHPAPGAETGTLVNALLHHCGASLSGIGGVERPGIVHRIDKDTSGLLVVAKSDRAHAGLAAQFAAHDVERRYDAICWGVPDAGAPRLAGLEGVSFEPGGVVRIDLPLGRHKADRKKMAVRRDGGRRAVTRLKRVESLAGGLCALLQCRLETGRTHQIRVHAAHIGHALLADPIYGAARKGAVSAMSDNAREALAAMPGQALHAATLGFVHPVSGENLVFEAAPPDAFNKLLTVLRDG
ncbi:RluA family pseudouridine synthase [Halovulum sp. GXIMD14794]